MEAPSSSPEKITQPPRKKTRRSRKRKVPITPAIVSSLPDSTTDPPLWPLPPSLLSSPASLFGVKPPEEKPAKVPAEPPTKSKE
ncbi:hypothetical protein PUN28_006142 [Cardiocondyla obscurior]|uniref:Histone H3 n=1 Tax=Cardiocondyla obscurior TaxID=286306 RepID=A0AAW2GC81_9HYME